MRKRKLVDIVTLVLIGIFISIGIFDHFSNNYILSVNFYLGCLCWAGVIFIKYRIGKGNSLVFWFLILLTSNILVCSAYIYSFGSVDYLYKNDGLIIASIGINPIFFLMLVIYSGLNYDIIRDFIYGSEKENFEKSKADIQFYYDKFNRYQAEELEAIYKMFNEYPIDAQIALKKIHKERDLAFIEF